MKVIYSKDNGFTLIEVLVSLLILAVGAMSIAALQFKALKYSHDASIRSQINILAQNIIEQIRLNPGEINVYVNSGVAVPVSTQKACGNGIVVHAGRTGCSGQTVNNLRGHACDYTSADSTTVRNCALNLLDYSLPPGSEMKISEVTLGSNNNIYVMTFTWTDREQQKQNVSYAFNL